MKKIQTTCPYCGTGCNIDLFVENNKIVKAEPTKGHYVNDGELCLKGRYGWEYVHSPRRLTKPLMRKKEGVFSKEGELVEVGFDEAYAFVASHMKETIAKNGPKSVMGLSSARANNEDNYVFQKLFRLQGTNNIDHCARICHAPTVSGLANTLGNGTMTNDFTEFSTTTDVFFLMGTNTSECHPIIAMHIFRGLERGAKMIVIDPKKTDMAKRADIYIQIPVGYNIPLLNAMLHHIIKENLFDKEFVEKYTLGFEYLKAAVADFTPERVEAETGILASQVIEAAEMYARAGTAAICYTMGMTQFTDGTSNIFSLSNMAVLTGNLGRKGGGVNPLRGQNNVQGACDMGALPNFAVAGFVTNESTRAHLAKIWKYDINPNIGFKLTEIPHQIEAGVIKFLYVMGENPVMSDPDTDHFIKAMKHLELLVVQDIFLTETAQQADVVLPAASWAEKDGTFTNTSRRIHKTRKAVEPSAGLEPDWQVVCHVAQKIGLAGFDFLKAEEIWNEVRQVNPNFYGGISYERLDELDGINWPCPDKNHMGTPILYTDHISFLPDGKFKLVPVGYTDTLEQKAGVEAGMRKAMNIPDGYPIGMGALSEKISEACPYVFTTGRKVYHYHTGTMTRECKPLEFGADIMGPMIEVSADIARERNLEDDCYALIENKRGQISAKVRINHGLTNGTIFTTFHYAEADGNELCNAADTDPLSGMTPGKLTTANIRRIEEAEFIKIREATDLQMHPSELYRTVRR